MADISTIPTASEVWFPDGKPSTQALAFFSSIAESHAIIQQGQFKYERFADLADVQQTIINPLDGLTVMFSGQGLGTYDESTTAWLLSADDTTPIV